MKQIKDKKAHDAMMRMRTHLIISQPFFGTLALHMGLVEVTDPAQCDTMAVDGRSIFYYPQFVLSLTEQELMGVGAHEVLHVAFQHMTRRGHRHPTVFNWAGDFVINSDLLKSGFTLPKQRLHDPKYDGMTTEEVYDRLWREVKNKVPKAGSGRGKVDDKGGCGGVWDAAPGHDKATADAVAREWETNVRMAVAVAKRSCAGKLPAYLERLVQDLEKPRINWRDQTRQWIDGFMSRDFSWHRPNRRFAAQGIYLPGYIPDALHHLVSFIDVSGSITNELQKAQVSEMAGALAEGVADRLTIAYFDTEVRHVDEFVPGDIVTCKTMGGGGTDFEPSFQWLIRNHPDASCCVYLTDMMPSHWNLTNPGIPVLWGCYLPAHMMAHINPPFGQCIQIDGAD